MTPTTRMIISAGFLLAPISIVPAAHAQTQTVETRIGKLDLDVGYPTKATAEKLYDEMDFQRATQVRLSGRCQPSDFKLCTLRSSIRLAQRTVMSLSFKT